MAWIESHQSLARHHKTRRLMRILGLNLYEAVGLLHVFWWWAMEFAPEGRLAAFSPEDLADAIGWKGEPGSLVSALLQAGGEKHKGFIEDAGGELVIHDWYEYVGRLLEKREKDAERKRNARKPQGLTKDVPRMSEGRPPDGAGNRNHDHVPKPIDRGDGSDEARTKRIVEALNSYAFTLAGPQVAQVVGEIDLPPLLLKDNPDLWCEWICLAIKEAADHGARNISYLMRVIQNSREKQTSPVERPAEKGGTPHGAVSKPQKGANHQPYRPPNGYERDLSGLTPETW